MNETTDTITAADTSRTEKRAWHTPTLDVFDVATSTMAGFGIYQPADMGTYAS